VPGGLERRLERGIDGFFGRVFRAGVSPVDLGRRLEREMDAHRTVGVSGRTVAPNEFTFVVTPGDFDQMADIMQSLCRELADHARDHAKIEHYRFSGPVEVIITDDESQRAGTFELTARFKEGPGGNPVASLVLPGGDRVPLDDELISIGRNPDSVIVMEDTNVSRSHAEIRPHGDGWVVVDLGSTNGTRVNGRRITAPAELVDGDELQFGNTVFRYEDD
jgi:hypothetical protein